MWLFSAARRANKNAKRLLRDAKYLRNMREDIAPPAVLDRLGQAEQRLREAMQAGDPAKMKAKSGPLVEAMEALCPPRPFRAMRENVEVIVVALTVAMAFRTYFVQPFKIPTGSMQPTLYGIHYEPLPKARWRDRFPLNLANWLLFGEWYEEVRAKTSGIAQPPPFLPPDDSVTLVDIGGYRHGYTNLCAHFEFGQAVVQGQVLASGVRVHGDHIFVNKVLWNCRRPCRGEIVVFSTTGIQHPNIKHDTFYIKRLVGVPGDSISISPPLILNHGERLTAPSPHNKGLDRIMNRAIHYEKGYQLPPPFYPASMRPLLATPDDTIELGTNDFLAFGDNTSSSLDGRYWGTLPRQNLVGPAFIVYWPASRRWARLLR